MNIFTSRQYEPVSQKVESDSEDDEVTLYASPKNNTDGHFGLGSYDPSRDLNLPPVIEMKRKRTGIIYSRLQTVCAVLLFTVVLSMVLALAIAIIILGQNLTVSQSKNATSNDSIATSCTPIPTPLISVIPTETPPPNSAEESTATASFIASTWGGSEHELPTTSEEVDTTTPPSTPTHQPEQTPDHTTFPSIETISPTNTQPTTTSDVPTEGDNDSLTTAATSTQSLKLPATSVNEDTPTTMDENTEPTFSSNVHSTIPNVPKVINEEPTQMSVSTKQLPSEVTPPTTSKTHSLPQFHWEREFFPSTTESSIQISDMNRDGTPDVITVQSYSQCGVKVIALDGKNGTTIWEETVNFEVFAVRCELDVNRDGVDDCLISGRYGGFAALDGANGTILWEVDKSIVYPRYNFYFPLIVRDMDADGEEDLINIHGGDQTYGPEETDRSPGSLVVISGATGQSLMDPIQLPDGHESYMSPILFKLNGRLEMIVFGTGGETIAGSLWAITVSSIDTRVKRKLVHRKVTHEAYTPFRNDTYHSCSLDPDMLDKTRPTFDSTAIDTTRPYILSSNEQFCPKWSKMVPVWNKYGVCLYKLMTSTAKGIMLPPVIVDLNKDGVKDLVVSTFNGHTIALDGVDGFTPLWDTYHQNTETYSLPAPVFYTDDNIPDLVIRTSLGQWTEYNSSTIRVLNGSDGTELWNISSAHTSMMSPLSIASYSPGLDAMLFMTVGTPPQTNTIHSSDGDVPGSNSTGSGVFDSNSTAIDVSDSNSTNTTDIGVSDSNSTNTTDEGLTTANGQTDELQNGGSRFERHSHGTFNGDTPVDGDQGYDDMFKEFNGEAREIGEEEDEGPDDPQQPQDSMDFDDDYIQRAMNGADPPGLWVSTAEDPFPDPNSDVEGFLEYCGESVERLRGYVWFVTKEMIERGVELEPLATHEPYIFMRPSINQTSDKKLIFKRHGSSQDPSKDDMPQLHSASPKSMRCAHISAPLMSFTTPALGDFNNDGRLDVAYSMAWGPLGGLMMVPPKYKVFVFTLEERFKEVYSEDVVVDFNGFLPLNEQPWSRYMGKTGDNVYRSIH